MNEDLTPSRKNVDIQNTMNSLNNAYPNSQILVEMYEIEESDISASLNGAIGLRRSSQSPVKGKKVANYSSRKYSMPPV